MKKVFLFGIMCLLAFLSKPAAAYILIDDVSDVYTSGAFKIYGNEISSGTGQNYEVLKFGTATNPAVMDTSFDGAAADTVQHIANDQAPHGDLKIGDLWSYLNTSGITSTRKLIIGFDSNEKVEKNDAIGFLDITSLEVTLGNQVYTLADTVRVDAFHQNGSSTAEARFEIDLGYDFMTQYNATSGTNATYGGFRIKATHANESNGGFDEYFLDKAYYTNPSAAVPEPASMALFGMGLAGLGVLRRRQYKA